MHSTPFVLGGLRRVKVKMIGSQAYVTIRECHPHPKNSKRFLSGKKGINLTVEEWFSLMEQSTMISKEVKRMLTEALQQRCAKLDRLR